MTTEELTKTEETVEATPAEKVETTDLTEESPEKKAEETPEEKKSRESREFHEANSQRLHEETMRKLRVDDPQLYEKYTGKPAEEPATRKERESLIGDEIVSIADMTPAQFAKFQREITYKTVEDYNTQRELRSEIGFVQSTVTNYAEQKQSTSEEIQAALAKAERILPKHKRTDPGDFKRWGELVVEALEQSAEKRRKQADLDKHKVSEEARVEKVAALNHPNKSGLPGSKVEAPEDLKQLERMKAVGPKTSDSLFDKNRK